MMTPAQLIKIMPASTRAGVFSEPLNAAMEEFGIATLEQRCAFLANVGHETGQLSVFEENLNYSAERLMAVWPKRFPTIASTAGFARNPVALANRVYANRMGNGDEKSGDGWRHRGAGCFQLTGKNNYLDCASHFRIAAIDVGDWLRTPTGAARSAAWYYTKNGMHKVSDFDKVCDLINLGRMTEAIGDSIGYKDRLAIYNRALETLS